jgi:hypothetical protein
MLGGVVLFELRYQLRRPIALISFLVFTALAFAQMNAIASVPGTTAAEPLQRPLDKTHNIIAAAPVRPQHAQGRPKCDCGGSAAAARCFCCIAHRSCRWPINGLLIIFSP